MAKMSTLRLKKLPSESVTISRRYDARMLPLVDEIPETPNHPYKGFVFETGGEKQLEMTTW